MSKIVSLTHYSDDDYQRMTQATTDILVEASPVKIGELATRTAEQTGLPKSECWVNIWYMDADRLIRYSEGFVYVRK